jgi:hypothetical protein
MKENNEAVSGWLQEIKGTVERFIRSNTRSDRGSGSYPKNGTWDDRIQGDDEEDQVMLPGVQSTAFDFIK